MTYDAEGNSAGKLITQFDYQDRAEIIDFDSKVIARLFLADRPERRGRPELGADYLESAL